MRYLWVLVLILIGTSFHAHADDAASASYNDDLSLTLQTEYVSEYVFRGVTFSGEAAQTSAEISFGKLKAGAWTSFVIGDQENVFTDEIDLYIGSGWELSDRLSGEFGATLYHFPQSGGLFDIGSDPEDASTIELYGGLDFDVPFSPSLTTFYDLHLKTTTLEGSLTYGIEFFDHVTSEFSVTAGLVEGSESLDYQYGKFSSRLLLGVTETTALFAGAHYGISTESTFLDTNFDLSDPDTLENPKQNSAWFSVGLQVAY